MQYLVIIISLSSAMFLLRNGSTWAIYCAALFLLPYLALKYSLHAQYDSMLLAYDDSRSSDIVYWRNIVAVFLNGPLLGINWWLINNSNIGARSTDDDEKVAKYQFREAAIVLSFTISILLVGFAYFIVIDSRLPETRSARKLVDKTVRAYERRASIKRESEERLRASGEGYHDAGEAGAQPGLPEAELSQVTTMRADAAL